MKNDIPNIIREIKFNYAGEDLSLIQESLAFSLGSKESFFVSIQNKKQESIAECSYQISDKRECFLVFIEVLSPKYIKKGIGTAMLKFVECDARKRGCTHMTGHYEPFDQYGDYAKAFYKRNNYEIKEKPDDIFKRLYKDLNNKKIEITR